MANIGIICLILLYECMFYKKNIKIKKLYYYKNFIYQEASQAS